MGEKFVEGKLASKTSILDRVLQEVGPVEFRLETRQILTITQQAFNRLKQRHERGTLTQQAIEAELARMLDVGGVEQARCDLVRMVRMLLPPPYNLKSLPISEKTNDSEAK